MCLSKAVDLKRSDILITLQSAIGSSGNAVHIVINVSGKLGGGSVCECTLEMGLIE